MVFLMVMSGFLVGLLKIVDHAFYHAKEISHKASKNTLKIYLKYKNSKTPNITLRIIFLTS
jgi:hypothetical protein